MQEVKKNTKKRGQMQTIKFTVKIKRIGKKFNKDISLKVQWRDYLDKDVDYVVHKEST